MAAIYSADIFCDDCAADIKRDIAADCLRRHVEGDDTGLNALIDWDGIADEDGYLNSPDIIEALDDLDERSYDSDNYPKGCSDDEESDCPQHCGSHSDCLNYEECSDGSKYGYFFGNSLTTDGSDYVKEAVNEDLRDGRNDSPAVELWMDCYDYIDYDVWGHCVVCGAWAELDDWGECGGGINCNDDDWEMLFHEGNGFTD